jgi:hypothetical protein
MERGVRVQAYNKTKSQGLFRPQFCCWERTGRRIQDFGIFFSWVFFSLCVCLFELEIDRRASEKRDKRIRNKRIVRIRWWWWTVSVFFYCSQLASSC